MKINIVIGRKERDIEKYIKSGHIGAKGSAICCVCGDFSGRIQDIICGEGFKLFERSDFNDIQRDEFMREYVDLIGEIGKDNDCLEWWATDVASKNRFTSKLPDLLYRFIEIINIIDSTDSGEIVIINPEVSILWMVREFCKDKGIDFRVSGNIIAELLNSICDQVMGIVNIVFNGIRSYVKAVFAKMWLRKKSRSLDKKTDFYVIKTFVYNHSFDENGRYRDSFFGKLPEYLKEKKKVLIYASILGNYGYCLDKIRKLKEKYNIIPLETLLSLKDIFIACRILLSRKIILKKNIIFRGYDVTSILNGELKKRFNNIQPYHFFHYWATKNLLKQVKVERLLLTYENNPWEKMCISAIKEESPESVVIGYQHTIVAQASANMFKSRYERDISCFPDKIFTVGEKPKEIIEEYGDYAENEVESSCALRFEYLFDKTLHNRKKQGNILLALEGIKEAYKVVDYIFEQLNFEDKYRVRIRTHPVLPWSYFQGKHGYDVDSSSNFEVSKGASLDEDLEWADIVVYWGSSVALEALMMGKPVIHFDIGSILNYDPLFGNKYLKRTVTNVDSLDETIKEIYEMSDEKFHSEQEQAREYLNSYFYEVNEENLSKFIN